MGFESDLFVSSPDSELICPLCYGVLQEPVQGTVCDHLFCRSCVKRWLDRTSKCPVDRRFMSMAQLRSPPKIIVNMINRMDIKCLYQKDGCDWIIKLGDLREHLSWCPFNPVHPESSKLKRMSKCDDHDNGHRPSPIKQLRVMANGFESDLTSIKSNADDLLNSFKLSKDLTNKFNDNFDRFSEMILDLEEQFKRVTDPLLEYICKDYKSKPIEYKRFKRSECSSSTSSSPSEDTDDDHNHCPDVTIKSVSINNLNEFICENVLSEFLRQNNIYVAKCIRTLAYNERSRNFNVVIRESDLDKILQPELWPKGVTISVKSDLKHDNYHQQFLKEKAVHGKRTENLPGVVITSGMSYWNT